MQTPTQRPESSTDYQEQRRQERRRGRIAAAVAFAGSVAMIVTLALLWPNFEGHGGADRRAASAVAEEIVMRHRQDLALEFTESEWRNLAAAMDGLEVSVQAPERFAEDGHVLLGGRYCTLRGRKVAELRLESAEGTRLSLFQMPWNDAVTEFPLQKVTLDGVRVELWHEGEVFFALAADQ